MRALETDWWLIELPDEWEAEQEDDIVVIEDEDGVSCIEISTLVREDGDVTDEELRDFAADVIESGLKPATKNVGDWTGLYFTYEDDGYHWREWYLRDAAHFLFIAYHCDVDNKGMDDAAVDEILSTIVRRVG